MLKVRERRFPPRLANRIEPSNVSSGGGLSKMFALIAKANVSLSVVMTLAGLAVAGVTLPIVLQIFRWVGLDTVTDEISAWFLALQLMGFIALPVSIGMVVRAKFAKQADRLQEPLRRLSYVLLLRILAAALLLKWDAVWANFWDTITAVCMLFGLALLLGIVVSKILFKDTDDQFSVVVEFGVRNLALGTAIGLGFQGNFDFLGPAAVYLLIEGIVLLTVSYARKPRSAQ